MNLLDLAPREAPPTLHGLVPFRGRLPFRVADAAAWTCLCEGGWLTIAPSKDKAREAYRTHVAGA